MMTAGGGSGVNGGLRDGLRRAAVVVAAAAALIVLVVATGGSIERFLHWIDFLAPMPGLSGLALLVLFPLAAAALFFAVNWVVAGFAGDVGECLRQDDE